MSDSKQFKSVYVHDEGIEKMFELLKDKMPAEQIATYIGLYHTYGAVMDEDKLADFFGLNRRTLRNQMSRKELPVRVIKRGHNFYTPTASLVSFLHQ